MIGIVDYGMGNLRSVYNALESLDCPSSLVTTAEQIDACDHLILPGVGAFAKAMVNLEAMGITSAIQRHVTAGKPLLGICLGMQLLATRGIEPYPCLGLDLIAGQVERLSPPSDFALPHVGWNTMDVKADHPLFQSLKRHADFYFVHSYQFVPFRAEAILGTTSYGQTFVSAVAYKNMIGIQFHPEKSQESGLRILTNFSRWDGIC